MSSAEAINKVVSEDDKTHNLRPYVWSVDHDDDDVGIVLTMPKHLITQILRQIRWANMVIVLTMPMHLAVQNSKYGMFSPSDISS